MTRDLELRQSPVIPDDKIPDDKIPGKGPGRESPQSPPIRAVDDAGVEANVAANLADWEAPVTVDARPEEALFVDLEGFSGPLDLLLALARTHKIDLARISLMALVNQYLAFIAEAKKLNLEIAADYLVMAAWLAFLKSRLLLPKEKTAEGELSGEELAARLQFQLQRLEAMRQVSAQLMTRKRLGLDVFPRGEPEAVRTVRETEWTATIYDLLKAYADQRRRTIKQVHVVKKRFVWSIKDARQRLEFLVGHSTGEWVQLDLFIGQYALPGQPAANVSRSVLASSFGATLEMARDGMIELRQDKPYAALHMRRKPADPGAKSG